LARVSPAALEGEWIHRHEEDAGARLVFVRAGAPLPPSRGRRRLVLGCDGALAGSVPGRGDAPEALRGRWSLDAPDRLRLAWTEPETGEERFRVADAEADRLVLVRVAAR
jgi:hypothetical protein